MYKRLFTNEDFRIRLTTNSRTILSLVNNYLDFKGKGPSRRTVRIDLRIDEVREDRQEYLKDLAFVHPEPVMNRAQWTGSLAMPVPVANVEIDHAGKRVKAAILRYDKRLKESLLDFVLFRPIRLILGREGSYWLHASAVSVDDRCVLTCGKQNSGKSTIALTFAQNGYRLLCDDDCFVALAKDRLSIIPFPTKMGIKRGRLKTHPHLRRHLVANYSYGGKERLSLDHLYIPEGTRQYGRFAILFPRYDGRKVLSIKNIPKDEALTRILSENALPRMWDKDAKGFSNVFHTFHALVARAACFEVRYNDRTVDRLPEEIERRAFRAQTGRVKGSVAHLR